MAARLTPAEVGMVRRGDAAHPWHVTEVTLLAGDGLRVDEVGARVAERIAYTPRFRQRVVEPLAGAVFVDDAALDLTAHVRRAPVPERAPLSAVQGFMGELMHAPIREDHPRWEMGVVSSLRGHRSALLTRVHPAWVDGIDHVHLLQELVDDAPNDAAPVPAPWQPAPEPDLTVDVASAAVGLLRDPAAALNGVGGLLGRLAHAGAAVVAASERARPVHVGGTGASLESLQRVARTFGTTVHDVLLAMVAGGLRRRGEREDPVALVPQAIEEEGAASALGFTVDPATYALPVRAETALDRLEHVASLTRTARETGRLVAAPRLTDLPGLAPATLHVLAARQGLAGRPHEVLVSHVPGPATPRYLGTRAVLGSYPVIGLLGGQRLSVGITVTAGRAWVGLCGTEPVAEPATGMIDELQELLHRTEED